MELEEPRRALDGAGARTEVVSISTDEIKARDHDLPAFCDRMGQEFAGASQSAGGGGPA